MNAASLELCKELYELSGWMDLNVRQKYDRKGGFWHSYGHFDLDHDTPAYDLGYLLRKLPAMLEDEGDEFYLSLDKNAEDDYMASYSGENAILFGSPHGNTPEDALCQLAIELFKQGALKP